jgi:DNA (cytosine-5)-methyltransferase 1
MATALGSIDPEGTSQGRRRNPSFVVPPKEAPGLPPAFTSAQAMNDLPAIDARALLRRKGEAGFRLMRLSPPAYAHVARNSYQRLMRNWPNMPAQFGVADHCIRCVPRDFRWFAIMKPGMRYPEIRFIAGQEFFRRILPRLRGECLWLPMLGTAAFNRFFAKYVPPYDPAKFNDKWRMIDPDSPCHTLLAHLGKDCYSHIHYDRRQARTISIREAARLQSFPDGFRFPSSMNASFRQIGNAVPPLLSYNIARALCKAIGSAPMREDKAFSYLKRGPS